MSLQRKINRARQVFGDTRWWHFKLQRRVMDPVRRQRMADFLAARQPGYRFPADTGIDPAASREALLNDGQILLPDLLSRDEAARLRDYFAAKPVSYPYDPSYPPFLPDSPDRPAHAHVAYHDTRDVLQAPGALELANHPVVLSHVAAAMGCTPTLSYIAAWWSYPTNMGAMQAENFHRDVDDWAFFKFFVYLTDVDQETGPHVYVRHSAPSPKLARIDRFADEEGAANFSDDAIISLGAPAGTGLIENTFGLHKGMPLKRGTRLMFQAVYSIFPTFYGPRHPVLENPLAPPVVRDNRWTNRVFVS